MKRLRRFRGGHRRRFRRHSVTRRAMTQMLRGGLLATLVLALCVGAVVARLSFGSISATALADPISRALNERLAPGWTARIAHTGIALSASGPALLSEGIEIRQPDGTLFLSAREGEIAVDPWRLLIGDVDVTSISFSGLDARLNVMPDGSLRADAAPAHAVPALAGEPAPPENHQVSINGKNLLMRPRLMLSSLASSTSFRTKVA